MADARAERPYDLDFQESLTVILHCLIMYILSARPFSEGASPCCFMARASGNWQNVRYLLEFLAQDLVK